MKKIRIVAIANEPLRQEFVSRLRHLGNVEILFAGTPEELAQLRNADAYFDLEFRNQSRRIGILKTLIPSLVFIDAVDVTLQELGEPFVRINAWPGFIERKTCEFCATKENLGRVQAFFELLQWQSQLVKDIPGMISARVLAMIINEAYFALGEKISMKEDIDIAMKLGTGYPMGPFEWAAKIGTQRIYQLLKALQKNDPHYSIAPMLVAESAADI